MVKFPGVEFFSLGSPKPGQMKTSAENGLFQRNQTGQAVSFLGSFSPDGLPPAAAERRVLQLLWFPDCSCQHDRPLVWGEAGGDRSG